MTDHPRAFNPVLSHMSDSAPASSSLGVTRHGRPRRDLSLLAGITVVVALSGCSVDSSPLTSRITLPGTIEVHYSSPQPFDFRASGPLVFKEGCRVMISKDFAGAYHSGHELVIHAVQHTGAQRLNVLLAVVPLEYQTPGEYHIRSNPLLAQVWMEMHLGVYQEDDTTTRFTDEAGAMAMGGTIIIEEISDRLVRARISGIAQVARRPFWEVITQGSFEGQIEAPITESPGLCA
ncbi:MAG: hypothetical protein WEA09_02305 [Gemmatimonadota bacterium]